MFTSVPLGVDMRMLASACRSNKYLPFAHRPRPAATGPLSCRSVLQALADPLVSRMSSSSGASGSSKGSASTTYITSSAPQSLDAVFLTLRKHMVVNDLVKVHATVKDLLRFVDPIQPCGHCHGRRLPLDRVHELVTTYPKQNKTLTSQLILAKLLPPNVTVSAETPPPDFEELWYVLRVFADPNGLRSKGPAVCCVIAAAPPARAR